jgi:hypothetical protein
MYTIHELAQGVHERLHVMADLKAWTAWKLLNTPQVAARAKIVLVDPIMVQLLAPYKVGQFREDKDLLAAADQFLRERHPELAKEEFVLDLLVGIHRKDVEAVIDETIVKALVRDKGISVRALLHPGLLKAAMTYLAEKYPHLEIEKGFETALLEGEWAEDVKAVLNEVDQQNNAKDVSHDCSAPLRDESEAETTSSCKEGD